MLWRLWRLVLEGLVGAIVVAGVRQAGAGESPKPQVDFSREIRPILSNNCFACHGPDEATREADLRLDLKEGALADLGGYRAIVPGKPEESELYNRISAPDPDERMPPADSHHQLSGKQIEVIRLWIEQGAPWHEHWAFIRPERREPPAVENAAWRRNPIDRFLLARLEQEGLKPSPEAEKTALIRRATLDLTGLPPTIAEIDAFWGDQSPDAYGKLVDRLLASPRYGEQMARYWLDLARYGDTHGLHLDNERSIWPYRDWLIEAFNRNLPYDQFTIEQLAGDLLPSPTVQQRIATGFNRCNVTTSEGGAIDEEFLVRYAVDRTETMGTIWLGLTVGCAVCHDHKFDPISQKEFYQLYAFFNSTQDKAMDGNALNPPPVVEVPSPEQAAQRQKLRARVAELESQVTEQLASVDYKDPQTDAGPKAARPRDFVWIDDELPDGARPEGNEEPAWQFVSGSEHPVQSGEKSSVRTAEGLSQHFFTGVVRPLVVGSGDKLFAYVYLDPKNPPQAIMLQFHDGASWEHRAFWGEDRIDWGHPDTPSRRAMGPLPEPGKWIRLEVEAGRVGLRPASRVGGWAFTQFGGTVHWDSAGIASRTPQPGQTFDSQRAWEIAQRDAKDSSVPPAVTEALALEPDKRNDQQKKLVRQYFLQRFYPPTRDLFTTLNKQLDQVKSELENLEAAIPRSMVTQELDPLREAFLLERGQYDKPKEKVIRGVPAVLPPMAKGLPLNRLGLARWLVDPSHPLTARVAVNRFWQQFLGAGLVKTAEDFGAQGEMPSHPELLDWLAAEFVQSGWDVKHIVRLIVTSGAYRQSSRIMPQLGERDPENRLLARGPRFRMDAEMLRDYALATSGLLVGTIGGPSVKPYQPEGLWEAIGYTTSNTARFVQEHGERLYRRSMYTFWKRTSPPPVMSILDAPSRETCTVRRARTNTPLGALALMNDIQFSEAARKLAERMIREGGPTAEDRITHAFRLATARRPQPDELAILLDQYHAQLTDYRRDRKAAQRLLAVGEAKRDESLDVAELAAWTMVANTLLNLDETVTK